MAKFVRFMHDGVEEYGCVANRKKTAVSFPMEMGGEVVEGCAYSEGDGARFMKWAGLLINLDTMEVQADYTR